MTAFGTPADATGEELVDRAREISDEVLFTTAVETDLSGAIPRRSLDALAAGGFYGLMGARHIGGLDADATTAGLVMEAFAGGCLTSAFIWAQHNVAVRLVGAAPGETAAMWGQRLCSGETRAGVAFAHLRREGPSPIVATPEGSGAWRVSGTANWMTGWGGIDVVNVAAVHDGRIVWFLCDAAEGPTLSVQRLSLSAVNSSGTVAMRLHDHMVEPERVIALHDLDEWRTRDRLTLRQNGSFALGLAGRCSTLLGGAPGMGAGLQKDIDAERVELDRQSRAGNVDGTADARARASWLAVRAAAALIASEAGKSMISSSHAQRLGREAMFLLVQGQTAPIRSAQLQLLL